MIDEIIFPIITFDKYAFSIVEDKDKLTTTTSAGVKNGLFDNLLIVDKTGKTFKVKDVKKLHPIGPFWGYNIFLNQKIKVELQLKPIEPELSLTDIKERILKIFKKDKYFWESGGNLNELIGLVENAKTIEELFYQLGGVINKQYKTN
ncbi:MAG TPA: hypothetical protein VD908_03335 [Cytophagales bacterium]|nr:hypothetical protein [Cytophagales bacterium]